LRKQFKFLRNALKSGEFKYTDKTFEFELYDRCKICLNSLDKEKLTTTQKMMLNSAYLNMNQMENTIEYKIEIDKYKEEIKKYRRMINCYHLHHSQHFYNHYNNFYSNFFHNYYSNYYNNYYSNYYNYCYYYLIVNLIAAGL